MFYCVKHNNILPCDMIGVTHISALLALCWTGPDIKENILCPQLLPACWLTFCILRSLLSVNCWFANTSESCGLQKEMLNLNGLKQISKQINQLNKTI